MANAAIVEVFGPLDIVLPALADLDQVKRATTNRVGCTVLDMGEWSATLGDEVDDADSTFISVAGENPDQSALTLFELLRGRLAYDVEVRAADDSEVLARRNA